VIGHNNAKQRLPDPISTSDKLMTQADPLLGVWMRTEPVSLVIWQAEEAKGINKI